MPDEKPATPRKLVKAQGALVHYVLAREDVPRCPQVAGEIVAALITRLWDDGEANLTLLPDGANHGFSPLPMAWVTARQHDENGAAGTWSLPGSRPEWFSRAREQEEDSSPDDRSGSEPSAAGGSEAPPDAL